MLRFLIISIFCLAALYGTAQASSQTPELDSEAVSFCPQLATHAKNAKFSTPTGSPVADFVLVDKSRRLLHLFANGKIFRSYKMNLGKTPIGKKRQEGDNKTPEGWYKIGYKNSASKFHLSLEITYPNQDDINWARKNGVDPGGDIMIHGRPNGVPSFLIGKDWTRGCVAVKDKEIEEIWNYVRTGTDIELCP